MSRKMGAELNGVGAPARRETQSCRISTVSKNGKSISVDSNMNKSRDLIPVLPYGIASSPLPGLMAFTISSQMSGSDGIIGVYNPKSPSCSPGECIMYSSGGATVKCSGDRVYINGIDILAKLGV